MSKPLDSLYRSLPQPVRDRGRTLRKRWENFWINKPQMGEFVIGLCDIYSSDCIYSIQVEKEEEVQNVKSDSVLKNSLIKRGLKVPTAVSRFCILPLILKFKLVLAAFLMMLCLQVT